MSNFHSLSEAMQKFRELDHVGEGPVLIVDDNDDDIEIARACYADSLLSRPFIELRSGGELLRYLSAVVAGDESMPAIVLLDINMPGMDGMEALAEMRASGKFDRVPPVVMLSNSDDPRDVTRARALGADGFQRKPVRMVDYVQFFNGLAQAA
jgi:CheY-like chemotaxis protein